MAKVGDRLGRYQLDRALGRGAAGAAFAATDTRLGEQVCIKVLHPAFGADAEVRARFEREVLLARKIVHRGVARVFDLGEEGETLYLIMQLVEGEPLSAVLERETFSPERAVAVLRQACQAVAAAHSEGVVHRDLKPSNLMLSPDGVVHVLDFGIATGAGMGRLTEPGKVVGSAAYMAPELWEGGAATAASDVWALGVVLYRCLTGRLPFLGDDWTTVSDGVRLREPPPPSSLRPGIGPDLDDVVRQALAKDPAHRPAGADAFDQALAPWTPDPFEAEVSNPRLSVEFLEVAAGATAAAGPPVVAGAGPVVDGAEAPGWGSDVATAFERAEPTQLVTREVLDALNEPTVDVTHQRATTGLPRWVYAAALGAIGALVLAIVALVWPTGDGEVTLTDPVGAADAGSVPGEAQPQGNEADGRADAAAPEPEPLLGEPSGDAGESADAPVASDHPSGAQRPKPGQTAQPSEPTALEEPIARTEPTPAGPTPTEPPSTSKQPETAPAAGPSTVPSSGRRARRGRVGGKSSAASAKAEELRGAYAQDRQRLKALTRERGLRVGDAPALDRAQKAMRKAAKRKRWAQAQKHASEALQAAAAVKVDRAFITRKLKRFNSRYDRVEDSAVKAELGELSLTISKAVIAKDYDKANAQLNRGFAKAAKAR